MTNTCIWAEDSQGQWYAECLGDDQEPVWFEDAQPKTFRYCVHCGNELDAIEFDDSEMIDDGMPPSWNNNCNPHGYVGNE